MDTKNKERKVYCHFSFRRPKDKDYGIFAVAFYSDEEGKKLLYKTVKCIKLWENHQFVTAIQSYENALSVISKFQAQLIEKKVRTVYLVTDNSTLAGWIEDPKKAKKYLEYMKQANRKYRVGSIKEIVIGVGLCEPRNAEKSYKYCKEQFIDKEVEKPMKSIYDIINEEKSNPDVIGMQEI